MNSSSRQLVGFADPLGRSTGFLIPVISEPGANRPRVERLDASGMVVGYADLEPADTPVLPVAAGPSAAGQPGYWAFGFGLGDVLVGRGDTGQAALRDRLAGDALADRPLLAMEIAEFLQLEDTRLFYAKRAYKKLARASSAGADAWRDLTLLTPAFRQALSQRSDARPGTLTRVTARQTPELGFDIQGLDPLDVDLAPLAKAALRDALSPMADLFNLQSASSVEVRLLGGRPRASIDGLQSVVALMYFADADKDDDPSGLPENPINREDLRCYLPWSLEAFQQDAQLSAKPNFVAFRLNPERGSLKEVAHPLPGARPPIGLAIRGSASDRLTPRERRAFNRFPGTRVILSGRLVGLWGSQNGISSEASDAIHVLTQMHREGHDPADIGETTVFARAKGIGPAPVDDAWAQLYARCAKLRLTRPFGLLFDHPHSQGGEPSPMREILFPDLPRADLPNALATSRSPVHAAMMMIDDEQPPPADWHHHGRVLRNLFTHLDWQIHEQRDDSFILMARPEERSQSSWDVSRRDKWPADVAAFGFDALVKTDLGEISHIVVSEEAGPAGIVDTLVQERALRVTVRDLTLFSAWSSTIWTLFGSQLRRMTSSLPSRPRSNYLAALVQAAVQHDQVRYAAARELLQVMHEPAFGRDVHLMCSRVQYREGCALADLRLAARYSSNLFKMRLFVDREGPSLLDPA